MSRLMKYLIFIPFIFAPSTEIKVKERFKNIPPHHFVFGFPCFGDPNLIHVKRGELSPDYAASFQKGLNYSFKCLDVQSFGTHNENGTYDGMIGVVERNETNTVLCFVPFDSVPYEPGIFVISPLPAFNLMVYSGKVLGHNLKRLDILNLFNTFSIPAWMYWVTSLTLVSIIHLLINTFFASGSIEDNESNETESNQTESNQKVCNWMKEFINFWWNFFMLAIDMAPTLVSSHLSSAVLWTSLVIACYYGIHMILMNTLSADLTAREPDSWIDSLRTLLEEPKFADFVPTVLSQFSTLQALKMTRKGTEERRLTDLLMRNGNKSIVSMNFKEPTSMLRGISNVFGQMMVRKRALIGEQFWLDALLEQFLFHVYDEGDEVVKSEPFLGSPKAMLLSHSTPAEIVQLFNYRSLTGVEFDIFDGAMATKMEAATQEITGVEKTRLGYYCTDLLKGNILRPLEPGEWNPLPVNFFFRLLIILLMIMLIALIVLMIEIIHFKKLITKIFPAKNIFGTAKIFPAKNFDVRKEKEKEKVNQRPRYIRSRIQSA